MPYAIVWLIFLHILPKLGILAMNAVIILRLKRAFARPSLQENRSQAMIAKETSSSAAAYSTDVANTQNNKMPKITRSATKTSLSTIHEEISTVSRVIFTAGGGRLIGFAISGSHKETGKDKKQEDVPERETKEERGKNDEVVDHLKD